MAQTITLKIIETTDDARQIEKGDVVMIDDVMCHCIIKESTYKQYEMLHIGKRIGDPVAIADNGVRVENWGLVSCGLSRLVYYYRRALTA